MIARSLMLAMVIAACSDASEQAREGDMDTIAPIGTGTERLLTHERLALVDAWIMASIAHTGEPPASLDDVRPPADEAARYVPLERYLRDGWGRRIEYEVRRDARSYDLRSVGEDGKAGTADDITLRSAVAPER